MLRRVTCANGYVALESVSCITPRKLPRHCLWLKRIAPRHLGYNSIEAHMEWRKQPEHAEAGGFVDELKRRGDNPPPAGLGIDSATGYFHLKC